MDVAASEFYGSDKTYDLNFKEEVSFWSRPVKFHAFHNSLQFSWSKFKSNSYESVSWIFCNS